MDETACGLDEAEQLVSALLAAQTERLPSDIGVYRRVVVRQLAEAPAARARAAMVLLSALGGLPSRAEVALACAPDAP